MKSIIYFNLQKPKLRRHTKLTDYFWIQDVYPTIITTIYDDLDYIMAGFPEVY